MKRKKNFSTDTIHLWEERHQETKELILDAASMHFFKQGYHKTTMREIADALDITIGTLYHYIKTKEDILFEICNRLTDEIEMDFDQNFKKYESVDQKLKMVVKSLLKFIASHNHALSVFLKEHKNLAPAKFETILLKRKKFERSVQDIIREGIEKGDYHDINPKIVTLCLFGMCNWSSYWLDADGILTVDEIADFFSTIFLKGISKRKEKTN